ncbi:hypothetical protein XMV242_002338 [Marinobacterium sp. xm-v-242]|nr:hypothetical protein [Marinobacterium sp. xm-v-242]NRP84123.1 hypothetical protein [Marinobacterium sp. xm-d-509]
MELLDHQIAATTTGKFPTLEVLNDLLEEGLPVLREVAHPKFVVDCLGGRKDHAGLPCGFPLARLRGREGGVDQPLGEDEGHRVDIVEVLDQLEGARAATSLPCLLLFDPLVDALSEGFEGKPEDVASCVGIGELVALFRLLVVGEVAGTCDITHLSLESDLLGHHRVGSICNHEVILSRVNLGCRVIRKACDIGVTR